MAGPARSRPLVGLIRNPRSHRNGKSGASLDGCVADLAAVPIKGPDIIARSPERRSELVEILAEFARERVDYIAIDGGDGTVRDVLTCGTGVFGEAWPALIVLPHGKTNALALDLGIPADWSLENAVEAAREGSIATRRPLVVSQTDDESARVSGFVLGGGAFTTAVGLGQDAHNFGAFNAAVVGVTLVWSALQAFFGGPGNPWRRGTRMRLRDDRGHELPHQGGAPADERFVLLASTLKSMPAGVRPFGDVGGNLQVAVMDNARRSLLARLPLIASGKAGAGTRRLGYHALAPESLEFEIGDRFILDGEAFPPGSYRMSAGPKLRFIVP